MILKDEVIDAVTTAQWGEQPLIMYAAYRAYARAIEAALLAKLSQGVEMPEPKWGKDRYLGPAGDRDAYHADQFQAAYAARAAAQLSKEPVATVTNNWPSDYSEVSRTYEKPLAIGTRLYTKAEI